jgi:hypothetical protein
VERGFEVVGVDCGFYRDGWLYNDAGPRPLTLTKDVRRITPRDVDGFDAVVHLAELSNDPLSELNERTTYDITPTFLRSPRYCFAWRVERYPVSVRVSYGQLHFHCRQALILPTYSSGPSRPRIRNDVAHHSDLMSLGITR